MSTTDDLLQPPSDVLEVYIVDLIPGLKIAQVRIAPAGCLDFSRRRYAQVRWHNVSSWPILWITGILPDPDYLCCPDRYRTATPSNDVPGAPAFDDIGPIRRFHPVLVRLPEFKGDPLHYRYDVVVPPVRTQSQTPKGGEACLLPGWNQDPHFVLQ